MREKLIEELSGIRVKIPQPTYLTILGQIRAGDVAGAEVGIRRLKRRLAKEGCFDAYRNR